MQRNAAAKPASCFHPRTSTANILRKDKQFYHLRCAAGASGMGSTGKEAAAKTAAAAPQPQMKLLVDKRSRRVLYAEARKDAVDFLIGLLRVPAGLAARVIASSKHAGAAAPPGSLGTLYAGARALEDAFFVAAAAPDRDAILCPSLPSAALPLLLAADPSAPAPAPPSPAPPPPPAPVKRYFRCAGPYGTSCRGNPTNVTDVAGLPCPVCRQPMAVEMRWSPGDAHGKLAHAAAAQEAAAAAAADGSAGGGYVKGVVSYLVMDDLSVAPMSTISAIMLLKKFKVADCSALEELTVDLGPREAVLLLKAALESATALTDVFCGGVSIDRIE